MTIRDILDQAMQRPQLIRARECMSCGHKWTAPVVMCKYTQNLSGEGKLWCSECSSGSVMSHPAVVAESDL